MNKEKRIQGKKASDVVSTIPQPAPAATAISALISKPREPAKIFLEIPEKSSMFIKNSEGDKPQLKSLNLMSLNDLPVGTQIRFERTLPKAKNAEKIDVTIGQDNSIERVL